MKFKDFSVDAWRGKSDIVLAAGESYQSAEVISKIKSSIKDSNENFIFEKFEAPQSQLVDALEQYSVYGLWGEKRVIEFIQDGPLLKADQDSLQNLKGGTGNYLLIRTAALQKTNWLEKTNSPITFIDCKQERRTKTELRIWLGEEAQKRGLKITKDALFEMINRLGEQTGVLENSLTLMELSKDAHITWNQEKLQEFFFRETHQSVFELTDALANQDLKKSLNLLQRFFERDVKIVELIGGLRNQLKKLILLKFHQGKWSRTTAMKELAIPSFVYEKTLRQVEKFNVPRLKKIYMELYNLDRDSKIGKTYREKDLFEMFVLKLFFQS